MRLDHSLIANIKKIHIFWIVFVSAVLLILLINAFHFYYPDEFDNISGGWYLLHGRLIYSGFFTHHAPVAYFVAALGLIFSGQSFVRFRIVYAFILTLIIFAGYWIVRKKVTDQDRSAYLFFIMLLSISATYFWGEMLLADNLAGYLLVPVYALFIFSAINHRRLRIRDLIASSIITALCVLTSLTYLYVGMIVYVAVIYLYFRHLPGKIFRRESLYPFFIMALPYLIFLLYLLGTGSLISFYQQNFVFNTENYVYNYPRPEGSKGINPIRFAVVIARDFIYNFHPLLTLVNRFDLFYPVNVTLAVTNAGFLIYLVYKRRYKLALFVLGIIIYANARSNPQTSKETDYQSAVYIIISLFNGVYLLRRLVTELNYYRVTVTGKIIFGALLLSVGFFSLFNDLYMFRKFFEKAYDKYMGNASAIYDRPQTAPIVNAAINPGDYMWIGPFEFENLFYANGRLPSKYHILIPGMNKNPRMISEILSDFEKNKPKVIMFNRQYHIFGVEPKEYASWFLDFLDANYVTLVNYRENGYRYRSVKPVSMEVDVEGKLYIDKDRVPEVVNNLMNANIIKKVSATE